MAAIYSDADVGWLAGMIDGEGSVDLAPKLGRGHGSALRLIIYSTSTEIIDKAIGVLRALGTTPSVQIRPPRPPRNPTSLLQIMITMHDSLTLYPILRPHMVEPRKTARYDDAYAFLAHRYLDPVLTSSGKVRHNNRRRVSWTPTDRDAWDVLRARYVNAR